MDLEGTFPTDPNGVRSPYNLDSFDHSTGNLTWPVLSRFASIGLGTGAMVEEAPAHLISHARRHLARHAGPWAYVRAALSRVFPAVRHPILIGDLPMRVAT